MIDIHCHLLPGIDDGAGNLDEALALARALVADGVRHVVATPHVYPGKYDNQRSTIIAAMHAFQRALEVFGIPLTISAAGEVRLTAEVLPMITQDELPFLGESDGWKNLLLEFPDSQIPLGAENFVQLLLRQGIRPVLVHPERNKAVMTKPSRLQPFIAMGCCSQITAASLLGQFGPVVQTTTEYMIDQGWVTAVASDAHNLGGRRPRMREARNILIARYGQHFADQMTRVNPSQLCGLELRKLAND